jgi:hypothetical protein
LNRLDRVGDLHQLAGGDVKIGEDAWLDEFHGLGRQSCGMRSPRSNRRYFIRAVTLNGARRLLDHLGSP